MRLLDLLRQVLGFGDRRVRDKLGLGDRRKPAEESTKEALAELDRLAQVKFKGGQKS